MYHIRLRLKIIYRLITVIIYPEYVDVNPVGITRAKASRLYFAIGYVYLFKTRTAKHKKTSQVSVVFHDEFVHVVQCNSIKC